MQHVEAALQYEKVSTAAGINCNFTHWIAPALNARRSRPIRSPSARPRHQLFYYAHTVGTVLSFVNSRLLLVLSNALDTFTKTENTGLPLFT